MEVVTDDGEEMEYGPGDFAIMVRATTPGSCHVQFIRR
jgi:hypothetical protein